MPPNTFLDWASPKDPKVRTPKMSTPEGGWDMEKELTIYIKPSRASRM